jgi:hypothetical protein
MHVSDNGQRWRIFASVPQIHLVRCELRSTEYGVLCRRLSRLTIVELVFVDHLAPHVLLRQHQIIACRRSIRYGKAVSGFQRETQNNEDSFIDTAGGYCGRLRCPWPLVSAVPEREARGAEGGPLP